MLDYTTQFAGKSLKKELLKGTDLANLITRVLIRFRQDEVALMTDINSMYYEVRFLNHQEYSLSFCSKKITLILPFLTMCLLACHLLVVRTKL